MSAQPHQAAAALRQQVLAGQLDPGPARAVSGHAGVDDAWIERAHRLEAQADALHHPGAEVLDHHVGARDQLPHLVQIPRTLQVRGVRPLVAVDGVEQRAVAVDLEVRDVELPAQLPLDRALDLDHGGPQVGQPQRCARPGQELAEIEDQQAFERCLCLHRAPPCCRCRSSNTPMRWAASSASSSAKAEAASSCPDKKRAMTSGACSWNVM